MDSLTQALLGGCTFALIKDKALGRKAFLIGAIVGTIPDLDVLLSPLFSEVAFLSVHRSVSHSFWFAVTLSIVLALLFKKKNGGTFKTWGLAFFISLFSHSLLDWCTTYGTKLFSPFYGHIYSINNIHVLEPMFTFILMTGSMIYLFKSKTIMKQIKLIRTTLILASLYLCWTFISKNIAANEFTDQLAKQDICYQKILVSPSPMNSILWHGIAKTTDGYYFGTYSHFDSRDKIEFKFSKSHNEILNQLTGHKLIKYYLDYTQDFPLVKADKEGNVEIFAIKFGPINYFGEPEFVYPLSFNINNFNEESVNIIYSGKKRGPVKNYANLITRIKGI